jgi:DNA-binding transcriptional LysR family regulator
MGVWVALPHAAVQNVIRGGHLNRRCPMTVYSTEYDAAIRKARQLRARAIADFWQNLRDTFSLHVPRLFPSEF